MVGFIKGTYINNNRNFIRVVGKYTNVPSVKKQIYSNGTDKIKIIIKSVDWAEKFEEKFFMLWLTWSINSVCI